MNHFVLYLNVIQFYLLNHTQNVISGRNKNYIDWWDTASLDSRPIKIRILIGLESRLEHSQHWPVTSGGSRARGRSQGATDPPFQPKLL